MVKYLAKDFEKMVGRPLNVAAQKRGKLVSYFIKIYTFVNAVGDFADLNMDADEINVQKFDQLSKIMLGLHLRWNR